MKTCKRDTFLNAQQGISSLRDFVRLQICMTTHSSCPQSHSVMVNDLHAPHHHHHHQFFSNSAMSMCPSRNLFNFFSNSDNGWNKDETRLCCSCFYLKMSSQHPIWGAAIFRGIQFSSEILRNIKGFELASNCRIKAWAPVAEPLHRVREESDPFPNWFSLWENWNVKLESYPPPRPRFPKKLKTNTPLLDHYRMRADGLTIQCIFR